MLRKRWFVCSVTIVTILILACFGLGLLVSAQEKKKEAKRQGKIAFLSDRDGNWEIYVMDADGKNQIRLTNNEVHDGSPTWSPNGKKIAFTSHRNGKSVIYVTDADGENQIRLTNNQSSDTSPRWSPDDKKIAFVSDRDGNREIYIMDANGASQTNLTNNPARDEFPCFSPDSKEIAFCSDSGKGVQIYITDVDGKNQKELKLPDDFRDHLLHGPISWSPDGKNITFNTLVYDADPALWVIDVNGKEQPRQVGMGGNPLWSPDSTKIVYATTGITIGGLRPDLASVCVIDATSKDIDATGRNWIKAKLATIRNAGSPCWSPDSKRIAFVSDRKDGRDEIYIMDSDGKNQTRLTKDGGTMPAWQPRPTK